MHVDVDLLVARLRQKLEDMLHYRLTRDWSYGFRDHTRKRGELVPLPATRTIAFIPTYLLQVYSYRPLRLSNAGSGLPRDAL